MIGLIVTGHGRFASGMSEALQAIAGPTPYYCAVDFDMRETLEELSAHLEEAMDRLKECESILILCDLAGGAPFKVSVELGYPRGYEVVAGTNLGMLVEINMGRQFMDDVHALALQAVTVGKDQIQAFEYKAPVVLEETEFFIN
ncbi:MAG: PTS sugar transporter subunit IIA [Allobaculum sp.]|nr:PTS sugar transporter subunit IIA [Allobaculum sp.]